MPHLTDRVPFHLSPDGRWLAITVLDPPRKRPATKAHSTPEGVSTYIDGSRVLLLDTTTGTSREPFPPGSISWVPQWSPDGRRLAAFAQHEGNACVAVWEAETGAVRFLREAEVTPKFEFESPQWLPDGRRIAAKLSSRRPRFEQHPETPAPELPRPAIEVLSFDPAVAEAQAGTPEGAQSDVRSRGDLAVIDGASGQVRRLACGWSFHTFRVAPDGHAIAVLRLVGDPEDPVLTCWDLVSVAVDTGEVRRLAPRVQAGIGYGCLFNWSPDSRQVAFFHIEDGKPSQLLVVPGDGSASPRVISGDEDLGLPQDEYYHAPRWSPDSRTVYALWRGVWTFAADGSARRKVAPDLGRRLRAAIQPPPPTPTLCLPDGRTLFVTTSDPATLKDGLARIDLETGEGELLAEFDHMWQVHAWGIEEPFAIELAPDGSAAYLAVLSADHPQRLWRLAEDFRSGETLFALSPETDAEPLGSTRLIEYRTLNSTATKRRGIVTLPPDYEEGQRLPVIVRVYHGVAISGWRHSFDGEAHDYARRGYAYLKPDILLDGPGLLRQLAGEVVPAVNHLIDRGIADPQRICLIGHSRGGYDALALITQTNRFCAAVVSAGTADLTSRGYGWGEHGCGGTVWDHRDAYVENSPFFYLDRVQTPLLMICGTAEPEEEVQARHVFGALRRLGKRVEVRLYKEEDHSPQAWTAESFRDVTERIYEWFDAFAGVRSGVTE